MNVRLRPLEYLDADTSYKWRNDAEIWEYTANRPSMAVSLEMEREWLKEVLLREDEKRFAICVGEDEEYIGNVQLTQINYFDAQFHIFIGNKEYHNKGIATTTTKLIINHAFTHLKLSKIYLFVQVNNFPAIRAYLKSGFTITNKSEKEIRMEINNEA